MLFCVGRNKESNDRPFQSTLVDIRMSFNAFSKTKYCAICFDKGSPASIFGSILYRNGTLFSVMIETDQIVFCTDHRLSK